MNPHETWSLPWQERLKHLAENLGQGTATSAGATSGAVAVAGTPRKGLRSRGATGVAGSWLGRARMGGAVARTASR